MHDEYIIRPSTRFRGVIIEKRQSSSHIQVRWTGVQATERGGAFELSLWFAMGRELAVLVRGPGNGKCSRPNHSQNSSYFPTFLPCLHADDSVSNDSPERQEVHPGHLLQSPALEAHYNPACRCQGVCELVTALCRCRVLSSMPHLPSWSFPHFLIHFLFLLLVLVQLASVPSDLLEGD